MPRSRHQKERNAHYALLVNRAAAQYQQKGVQELIDAIKARGAYYTLYEPDSAMGLLKQAQQATQLHEQSKEPPMHIARRGEITALVACGGDGTVNLVARAAVERDLPIGVLPMGRFNNIARSVYGSVALKDAVGKIVAGNYRKCDIGMAADQPFLGAVAIGFVPELFTLLKEKGLPRFGLGWSQLAAKAAASVKVEKMVIKIDAFRFEFSPIMLNVQLLPYAAGLPFSNASLTDDGEAEVIFDLGGQMGEFSSIVRAIHKKKYLFCNEVRLYRGKIITLQPTKDRMLYLDGELIPLPTNSLAIRIGDKQVKVFC